MVVIFQFCLSLKIIFRNDKFKKFENGYFMMWMMMKNKINLIFIASSLNI